MGFRTIFMILMALFAASQVYWLLRARALLNRLAKTRRSRVLITVLGLTIYVLIFALNFGLFGERRAATHLTLYDALIAAPFQAWVVCSILSCLVAILLWPVRRLARSSVGLRSPARRQFLERTVSAAVAAPFVAGAYGLFYGRLNLETTRQRVRMARLPGPFDGFRILQLSDIHIGPFMPEDQIRKFVRISNDLRPDLIALTGDFVTWDPSTQRAVVNALAGLRAPFGVWGCLGNHEAWSGTEDSITQLFRQVGIRILRHERTSITAHGASVTLIGVDYQTRRHIGPDHQTFVGEYLENVHNLMVPDTVSVLMSHNPDTFDRAAELGIDLSLAGHTHGGQVSLEFVSPQIAPSRLVTPYVAGWFGKPGGQLYVNRGIGTIGVPMRVGAPPEITIYELVRA